MNLVIETYNQWWNSNFQEQILFCIVLPNKSFPHFPCKTNYLIIFAKLKKKLIILSYDTLIQIYILIKTRKVFTGNLALGVSSAYWGCTLLKKLKITIIDNCNCHNENGFADILTLQEWCVNPWVLQLHVTFLQVWLTTKFIHDLSLVDFLLITQCMALTSMLQVLKSRVWAQLETFVSFFRK